ASHRRRPDRPDPRQEGRAGGSLPGRCASRLMAVRGKNTRGGTRATAGRTDLSFGPLADIVGMHVSLANAAIMQNFKKRFDRLQLTPKQTSLLWLVSDNPG